jgi:hypothetical protein
MDNRILIFNDGKNYFPLKATATEKDIIRFLNIFRYILLEYLKITFFYYYRWFFKTIHTNIRY